jgi:hypothetical protein
VARFYCDRRTGLSIRAAALGRMIASQGGYLNTQDPAEVAFVRATDYYKRGMIVEQPISIDAYLLQAVRDGTTQAVRPRCASDGRQAGRRSRG